MDQRGRHSEIPVRWASIELSPLAEGAAAIQVVAGHRPMYEYETEELPRDARLTWMHEETSQIDRFGIMEAVAAERAA